MEKLHNLKICRPVGGQSVVCEANSGVPMQIRKRRERHIGEQESGLEGQKGEIPRYREDAGCKVGHAQKGMTERSGTQYVLVFTRLQHCGNQSFKTASSPKMDMGAKSSGSKNTLA